jgi:hypothetical protein
MSSERLARVTTALRADIDNFFVSTEIVGCPG